MVWKTHGTVKPSFDYSGPSDLPLSGVNCSDSSARKESIRSLVLPKSTMAVKVVTVVSAETLTLVVLSATATALIERIELYDMRAVLVFALTLWLGSSFTSIVQSRAMTAL